MYVYKNADLNKNWAKYDKMQDRAKELSRELSNLKEERHYVNSSMESDPETEAAGGPVADKYGDRLNIIDQKINKLEEKFEKLNQDMESLALDAVTYEESDEDVPAHLLQAHFNH